MNSKIHHEIEIDCPPGENRPDYYLEFILEDTGLLMEDFRVVSKVFGNWSFRLQNTKKNQLYSEKKEIIGKKLTYLYEQQAIRYASW